MEVGEEAQEATIRRRSGRSHSAAPFGYDADGWSGSTSQLPSRLQQPLGISNAPATQPPFRDRLSGPHGHASVNSGNKTTSPPSKTSPNSFSPAISMATGQLLLTHRVA